MTLKKSDKIIAVVGVIILIIAGIGIVYYASNEDKTEGNVVEEPTLKTFNVMYDEVPVLGTPKTIQIRPKILRQATASDEFTINAQNLKSVEVIVTYDDKSGLFPMLDKLKFIGGDTLTVTLKDAEGNQIETNAAKGDKKVAITETVGQMITTDTIEAVTMPEAQSMLESLYVDYQQSYTLSFSLKTGLIGKIREMIGKHNIKIEVNYVCYDYYLEEVGTGGDDGNPPTDFQPGLSGGPYYQTNQALTKT